LQQTGRSAKPLALTEHDNAEQMAYTEATPLSLADMLDILFRRGWWMLAVFLLIITLGMAWTMTRTRQYASTTELMVSQNSAAGPTGGDIPIISDLASLNSERSIATQVRILKSPDLIQNAFVAMYDDATQAPRIHKLIQQSDPKKDFNIDIQNIKDTDVISIMVTAKNMDVASAYANQLAQTYRDKDMSDNRESTHTASVFIGSELDRVKHELDAARAALASYQIKTGIVDVDETLTNRADYLGTLQADSAKAAQDYAEAQRSTAIIGAQLNKIDKTILAGFTETDNPVVLQITGELETLESQRAAMLQKYQPGSREIQQIDRQIAAARARKAAERATSISANQHAVNPVQQALQTSYLTADNQQEALKVRVQALKDALAKEQRDEAKLPTEGLRFTQLTSNVKQLETTYDLLNTSFQTLSIDEQGRLPNAKVITKAAPNPTPVSPKIPLNAALFMLLGLVCAIGLAMLLEALDDRVYSEEMIERISNRPILAYVPVVTGSPRLLDHPERHSAILESIRLLRSNLTFASMDEVARTIMITSPGASEGKSSTVINLAIALAMDGKRVIIVDCDLRRPSMHSYFGLSREIGLTNVATGHMPLEAAIQPTSIENVSLLSPGPLPPNPPEVLNSQGTRKVIAQLAELFDFVLLDTPPAGGLSDASVLSTMVDGMLMVISSAQTHRGQLRAALRTLENVDAPLLGYVFNKVNTSRRRYGSYYYYYYYYYYYTAEEGQEQGKKAKKRRRHRSSEEKMLAADVDANVKRLE
jgi:capsular exopolysaccharide synthesis family protein